MASGPETTGPGRGAVARMNAWADRLERHNARVRAGDRDARNLSTLAMTVAAAAAIALAWWAFS
jgi:hypothetical protein